MTAMSPGRSRGARVSARRPTRTVPTTPGRSVGATCREVSLMARPVSPNRLGASGHPPPPGASAWDRSRPTGGVGPSGQLSARAGPATRAARGRAPARCRSRPGPPSSGTARRSRWASSRTVRPELVHRAVARLLDDDVPVGVRRDLRQVGDDQHLGGCGPAAPAGGPISTAAAPPTPASTSSKTKVGTGLVPASATSSASITRDSSPPDAPLCSGRGRSPRVGQRAAARPRRRRRR